jgi:hypothetical protein
MVVIAVVAEIFAGDPYGTVMGCPSSAAPVGRGLSCGGFALFLLRLERASRFLAPEVIAPAVTGWPPSRRSRDADV